MKYEVTPPAYLQIHQNEDSYHFFEVVKFAVFGVVYCSPMFPGIPGGHPPGFCGFWFDGKLVWVFHSKREGRDVMMMLFGRCFEKRQKVGFIEKTRCDIDGENTARRHVPYGTLLYGGTRVDVARLEQSAGALAGHHTCWNQLAIPCVVALRRGHAALVEEEFRHAPPPCHRPVHRGQCVSPSPRRQCARPCSPPGLLVWSRNEAAAAPLAWRWWLHDDR